MLEDDGEWPTPPPSPEPEPEPELVEEDTSDDMPPEAPEICHAYVDLWKKCEALLPEASREAMQQGYDAFIRAMWAARGNLEAMKAMETACQAGVDGLKPVCSEAP